jgi:hypothetical protein
MQNKTKLIHSQYKTMVSWVNMYLKRLSDDDLKREIAPGKNHGVWLLGHLIASDDDLSLYFGKGTMLYPDYSDIFGQGSVLKPLAEYPPVSLLREQWKNVTDKNIKIYAELHDEELNEPHAMIKGKVEDDFFKTKENCSINWLLHQMYHAGQLGVLYAMTGKEKII